MGNETKSIRVNAIILEKVKSHISKTKQSMSGFYDLAAQEKMKNDKLANKMLKSNIHNLELERKLMKEQTSESTKN
jgi:hypothetical protein